MINFQQKDRTMNNEQTTTGSTQLSYVEQRAVELKRYRKLVLDAYPRKKLIAIYREHYPHHEQEPDARFLEIAIELDFGDPADSRLIVEP